MDRLSAQDLREIVRANGPCVSIYMPTHRAGREVQQGPIRLKNLLGEAEERLIAGGLRAPEAREFLEPAETFVQNGVFWQYQSDGLTMFLASDLLRYYRLPLDFDELVVVAGRFHLKPLFPLLGGDGRFYVLALSQNEVRLLQGTRYSVGEVHLEDVPESLAEALRWDDPEKRVQFHTTTRTPGGERVRPAVKSARPAIFHGHGVASADDPTDTISRYFHRVDDGLNEVLGGEQAPLILAAVDYLHPIYRDANTYPHLIDEGIEGNPEALSADELHRRAWAIAQPLFLAEREQAAARYRQLSGAGSELASSNVEAVVPAAYVGRVETLFVAVGLQRWGSFDAATNRVELHEEAAPGDEDVIDFAAVHTFLNGGTIYAVEPEKVPDDAALAAIFRY